MRYVVRENSISFYDATNRRWGSIPRVATNSFSINNYNGIRSLRYIPRLLVAILMNLLTSVDDKYKTCREVTLLVIQSLIVNRQQKELSGVRIPLNLS